MIKIKPMKKKLLFLLKICAVIGIYAGVFILAIFFTMKILIKGDDIKSPDLRGLHLKDAYKIAAEYKIKLKENPGNYSKKYEPSTVIDQFPEPGVLIKEKSYLKVFITSELIEVIVPDLTGYSLIEGEKLLGEYNLVKRYVSYMDSEDVPVDFVISQSHLAGTKLVKGSQIDILVSRGKRERSFIMPDIIGKRAETVVFFFESRGLKITKMTEIEYPGLDAGIIIQQHPSSGFSINSKNLISVQVSK